MAPEMIKVFEDDVAGNLEIVTSIKLEELVAGAREKVEVPMNFYLPEGAKPKKMFLDLSVRGESQKWRVYMGDFSVTKEFKPLIRNGDISKFVFDITPIKHIVMEEPVLRVSNDSTEPIELMQASLFVFYEYPSVGNGHYQYFVTAEPKGSFWGPLRGDKDGYLYSVIYAPEKTKVKIKVGDCEEEQELFDVYEISLQCPKAKSYFVDPMKEVVPLSLVVGSVEYKLPKIVIEKAEVVDNTLRVKIRNDGEDAEQVIILVYTPGRPLARESLGSMKKGDVKELSYQLSLNKGFMGVNVRVIWVKANLRDFVEKFVPV